MNTFTSGDQSDDNLIICPHCGSSTQAEPCDGDASEDEQEDECSECGKEFIRWAEISITYYTKAKEAKP
jgi:DNA-directed RNA polymerase subunit RPC12/RpoP